MKRTVILLSLLLALAAGRALAYTEVVKKIKCPLCGTPIAGSVVTSWTQTSMRLDLKPLGDLVTPDPLLTCPSPDCQFVIFSDHISPALRESLRAYVKSDDYHNELFGNTSYYLLGRICEYRKMPAENISWIYLKASWQSEDDTARYHRYLGLSQKFCRQSRSESKDNTNKEYAELCIKDCEMLRLLGRFDEAAEVLAVMKKNYLLDLGNHKEAIELENKLIGEKDCQPQEMKWKREKETGVSYYNQAYGLAGFDQMQAEFEMDSLYYGKVENDIRFGYIGYYLSNMSMPTTHNLYSKYYLVAILHPQQQALLSRIYWYIDYDSKKLLQTWQDFLKTQQQISAKVEKLGWLRQWQQADSNRVVETRFLGKRLNALPNIEKDNVRSAWTHSQLKGSPDMQVKLYRQEHCFCTLYFGDKEDRALVYASRSGRSNSTRDQMMRDADSVTYFKSFGAPLKPSHWLDVLEVEYSPSQQVPSYAVVDPDGRYHINGLSRIAAERD